MNAFHGIARIRQRVRITGSSALALSTVFTNLIRVVSTVILSRLLSPDVYGISGLILSIFYVFTMLSDVGFQAYVVRHHRSDEPDFIDAVWTIHAGRGIVLTIIAMLLAWPLSLLLAKPEVALPLAVASLVFAIDGQASLNQFRALRKGRVQRFALMQLLGNVGQVVFTIVVAFFVPNIWAIVSAMIAGSAFRAWLSYSMFPGRRSILPDKNVAADLWNFSRLIAVSSALTLVVSQIDKLAMSRILTLAEFGTYVIASTVAAAPATFAYSYGSTIVYPATAAAWRNGTSISKAYYACWGRFFYLYAFGVGGLIGSANLLVRILYDPRYLLAASYLAILAIATVLRMTTRAMEETLVGIGHQRASVGTNVVRIVWLAAGGVLALIEFRSMLFVLAIGLVEIPVYVFALWRMNRLGLIRWPREISIVLTIAAGVAMGSGVNYLGKILLPNV